MRIKDYKCKCEHNDFFFADKGYQIGIYCSYCGKWLKWADKDEQNLRMKQVQKTDVLDKIIAEIKATRKRRNVGVMECLDIIDRHKAEESGGEE